MPTATAILCVYLGILQSLASFEILPNDALQLLHLSAQLQFVCLSQEEGYNDRERCQGNFGELYPLALGSGVISHKFARLEEVASSLSSAIADQSKVMTSKNPNMSDVVGVNVSTLLDQRSFVQPAALFLIKYTMIMH